MKWYTLMLCIFLSACQTVGSQENTDNLVSPQQGTFVRQVELVGNIEAQQQIYLAPTFSAKLEMIVEEGVEVKKGDVVARLEVKTVEDELDEKDLALETAQADLSEQDRNTAADKVRLQAEIQRAEIQAHEKKLALKQLEAGTRPEELKKKELAFNLAQKARELAHSDLNLKEKLALKGMSTQLEVLQSRLLLANQEQQEAVARADLEKARQGATALEFEEARLEVQQALNDLAWAQKNKDFQFKQAALDRRKKETKLNAVSAEVKQLRRQMKEAELKAPLPGTVVLNKTWTQTGLKQVSVGDDVVEGNPFMSVADLAQIVIRAEVPESLLRDLKIDLPVSINLPSMQGKRFSGKLSRIGVLAHERSGRQVTVGLSKVFDIDILPDEQGTLFQPGTSVDIQLPLKQKKDVLLLPRQAIYREADRHYVILANGQERDVTIGELNAKEVEIVSGLTLDEQVQLPTDDVSQAEVKS